MAKRQIIQGGRKGIQAHFQDAISELESAKPIVDPDPSSPRNGIKPGQWPGAPWSQLPPGCPFEVLGNGPDGTTYVRTATHHLMEFKALDLQAIMRMCAPYPNFALWAWPGFGKPEIDPETGEEKLKVKRLERDRAATCIITEAAKRGTFDKMTSVRGRGGWRVGEHMIWHSGEKLWLVDVKLDREGKPERWTLKCEPPVSLDGKLYAKAAETLAPWRSPVSAYDSPAHQILQDLTTWNWERPWLDPLLMLGWIGVAMMGGAPKVRPAIGLVGGRGTGKSTLHDYLKAVFGSIIYATANTTAAGIYQNIGQDSRPVLIDEFEAKAGSTKEQSIIELMRQSYSGGHLYRGSSDHEGVQFQMYSAFLLSAISLPPLSQQDRSRMALLHLNKLNKVGAEPVVQEEWGRMILRQVMDGWHSLQMEILPRWSVLLFEAGLDARQIDTYGTLLATAEMLVGGEGMMDIQFEADDREWVINALRMATAVELSEQTEKWQDVIDRLLSTVIDQWKGGERRTVGKTLELYEKDVLQYEDAREALELVGLGLRKSGDPMPGYCLAVPHSGAQLERIFERTDYYGGGWGNVLKQAPEEIVPRDLEPRHRSIRINGKVTKTLLVDMAAYQRATMPEDE